MADRWQLHWCVGGMRWTELSWSGSWLFLLTDAYFFSALTLLVGCHEEHLACKKFEWSDTGMVI